MEDETIPYFIFHFPQNSKTYEDFLKDNPSLKALFSNEKFMEGRVPRFYYDSFNNKKLSKFQDYICAVLDLYEVVCRSRNTTLINYITGTAVKLTEDHLWNVVYDYDTPIVIRNRILKLIQTILINTDDFHRITEFRNRCYKWDDIDITDMLASDKELSNNIILNKKKEEKKEDKVDEELIKVDNTLEIYKLYKWYEINDKDVAYLKPKELLIDFILNFWSRKYNIAIIANLQSMEQLLLDKEVFLNLMNYQMIIFNITKDMCDFGFFSREEIKIIMIGIAYFFSIFETYKPRHEEEVNTIIDENKQTNLKNVHWLSTFSTLVLDSEYMEIKSLLFKLYEISISILNIIVIVKEDMQLLYFIKYFKHWSATGNSFTDTTNLSDVYFNILTIVNLFKFEIDDDLLDDGKDVNLNPMQRNFDQMLNLDNLLKC